MQSSISNRNAIISRKILAEICVALKDLGADSKLLGKVKACRVDKIYTAAEDLGAPAMLLAFIGSWVTRGRMRKCSKNCKDGTENPSR